MSSIIVDVHIVEPSAPPYARERSGCKVADAANVGGENAKISKDVLQKTDDPPEFVPFVLESTGRT